MGTSRAERWGHRWGNILSYSDRDQDKLDLVRDLDDTELWHVIAWLDSWKDDFQREQKRRVGR